MGTGIKKVLRGELLNIEDVIDIKEFSVYQIVRTKAMLDHSREMSSSILTSTLTEQFSTLKKSEIKEIVKKKIEKEITPQFDLELVGDILPHIADLELVVLDNKTEEPFITSDTPVIVTNPFAPHQAGLKDIGTVLFFPVSPQKLIIIYDSRLYGTISPEIRDQKCIEAFNFYQCISADERILSNDSATLERYYKGEKILSLRAVFQDSVKTNIIHGENDPLFMARARSIDYYFDIPIIHLPKQLRKIPEEYIETFSRDYNKSTRIAILCRIYREPTVFLDEKFTEYWKKSQAYSKILLEYLDYYWHTPNEDCVISGELMCKLKTVPVNFWRHK